MPKVGDTVAPKQPSTPGPIRSAPALRFVARQPIFDRSENVFGYELLFRNGPENCFQSSDVDRASRSTVDSSLQMGLDLLCDERRAFVSSRDVLLKGYMTLLPLPQTIVEVLESVQVDEALLSACRGLKRARYLIALGYLRKNRDPGRIHRHPRSGLSLFQAYFFCRGHDRARDSHQSRQLSAHAAVGLACLSCICARSKRSSRRKLRFVAAYCAI